MKFLLTYSSLYNCLHSNKPSFMLFFLQKKRNILSVWKVLLISFPQLEMPVFAVLFRPQLDLFLSSNIEFDFSSMFFWFFFTWKRSKLSQKTYISTQLDKIYRLVNKMFRKKQISRFNKKLFSTSKQYILCTNRQILFVTPGLWIFKTAIFFRILKILKISIFFIYLKP